MRRAVLTMVVLLIGVGCVLLTGQEQPAKKPNTVNLNGHTFTLPLGFTIELVAGPPLVQRPIVADFDEQGRLYVAESSGTNDPVAKQLENKPHRILRLEDTKGNGKFDKVTVFADKMMFPEGSMWHNGSLYVAAPPSIWKLTDTNGDGVADERIEWFKGKTLTGCANDLHGPYLGPDGWIYWCKGAFAEQKHKLPNKKMFTTRASHIFRARPDGTSVEPVMTGGMDNPVDVIFTPGGERIFTTTFLVHPGGGKRDGLIHAIHGGINGKDHNVIYDPAHKWTGPDLMPVLSHLGPAVPSGLVRYESGGFGFDYKDNLFTALFNLHKVTRHVLKQEGATFTSRDEDFVVSSNLDFHPTDVVEDADGSLLIIDTGGWYKLCCPSSQFHKPDIPGAIYRVRKKDAAKIDDPRGLQIKWDTLEATELEKLLEDRRPVVRRRAIQALGTKGAPVVGVLTRAIVTGRSVEMRRNAIWTATRIDGAAARKAVRHGLGDADETVRQVAAHSVSLWRDREALPGLQKLLRTGTPHNQRIAAEALGRIGDPAAVADLQKASEQRKPGDRVLEHSLTYALIEIGDRSMSDALKSDSPAVRRDVLVALDQMDNGKLDARTVANEMTATDPRLRETAWWIAGRHPEWGEELAGFFRERLSEKDTPAQREELLVRLARFAQSKAVQELLASRLREAPVEERRLVLRALAQANLKEAPATWLAALSTSLADKDLVRDAISTARVVRIPKSHTAELSKRLQIIADDEKATPEVRIAALEAIPGSMELSASQLKVLKAHLGSDHPVAIRSLATNVLSRAKLSSDQLLTLAESLKPLGPMELDRLLDAFGKSTEERVGKALLTALKDATARSSLRVDAIRQQLTKYPPAIQKQAEELYALLDADLVKQRAKLDQMLAALKDGDVRRGQKVYHSPKTACAACHSIAYLGGKIGPDLTHIGRIRSERDLLEAIVFPSASLVRSYEPMMVTTGDGKTHNGLIKSETSEEIVLVTGADQQIRIARKDIEQIQPSKVSVMPSGLDQQLTTQDLADLVSFLRALK